MQMCRIAQKRLEVFPFKRLREIQTSLKGGGRTESRTFSRAFAYNSWNKACVQDQAVETLQKSRLNNVKNLYLFPLNWKKMNKF